MFGNLHVRNLDDDLIARLKRGMAAPEVLEWPLRNDRSPRRNLALPVEWRTTPSTEPYGLGEESSSDRAAGAITAWPASVASIAYCAT
jgi:hypothetical protein